MSWASKIKAHGQKQARAKAPARPKPVVQECYVTVRRPTENDPGEVAPAYFTVENDHITLTTDRGEPIGKPVALNGQDPRRIAGVLAHQKRKDGGDFNRRLEYSSGGIV
ncbi:hypothetical protein CWO91_36835 [Bradyrhizobium genosp. SA-3]|uniref:hypothetical protein n=1 Tax=Bradyrhizobium genosp. SA-3 TaxID=508868 RepID=UPI001028E207|nr:hypothetical protein [Bradyrhizobium genosp. SA-3]RZM98717.1 hypothetical protein CWO91_36835 [Bradyrhizobium genosp. SA-3]